MPAYLLSMQVELVRDFESDTEAIAYIESHTVLDLLDAQAKVSNPCIVEIADGNVIYYKRY